MKHWGATTNKSTESTTGWEKEITQAFLSILPKKKTPLIKSKYPELGKLSIETTDFQRDIGYNQAISTIEDRIKG